jgi:hypothetical protein
MIIAHVGAVPLEEFFPAAGGLGFVLLAARHRVALHLLRRREPGA